MTKKCELCERPATEHIAYVTDSSHMASKRLCKPCAVAFLAEREANRENLIHRLEKKKKESQAAS